MHSVTKPAPDRVDISISGSLDAEAMAALLDELIAASQGVTRGRMFYRIDDFAMPTAAAIGVELRRLPKLFSLVGRFRRCAVVSGTGWIRRMAEIEGALIPGLEIRSFEPGNEATAEAWLAA